MPALNGYRVWIEIDGEEVKEYEDMEPDDPPGCILEMAEVYIVSSAGKEFTVCWSSPPNVDVEGEVILENIAITATQLRKRDKTRVVRECGAPDEDGNFRAFQFQTLTIDVDAIYEEGERPDVGLIAVDIGVGKFGRPKKQRANEHKALTSKVHQQAKALQEHTVALGRIIQTNDFVVQESDFIPNERRMFVFRYNSRGLLEADGKIPTRERERYDAKLAEERDRHDKETARQAAEIAKLRAELERQRSRRSRREESDDIYI